MAGEFIQSVPVGRAGRCNARQVHASAQEHISVRQMFAHRVVGNVPHSPAGGP